MNGRVQDPLLGRFLSPDPIVQAPYDSRSLNRYSYVWNNPLTLVDPSGFQQKEICYNEYAELARALGGPSIQVMLDQCDFDYPGVEPDDGFTFASEIPQDTGGGGSGTTMNMAVPVGVVVASTVLLTPVSMGLTAPLKNPYVAAAVGVTAIAAYALYEMNSSGPVLTVPTDTSGTGSLDVGISTPGDPSQQDKDKQRRLTIDDQQLGKKFGEHMDSELRGYRSHQEYRALAEEIYANPESQVTRYNSGPYSGETHYQLGNNLLRTVDGVFRSLYPL